MYEDKSTDSQEVFVKAQMKAITSEVRGLLEKTLKDHVGGNMLHSHWEVAELNFKYECACKSTETKQK